MARATASKPTPASTEARANPNQEAQTRNDLLGTTQEPERSSPARGPGLPTADELTRLLRVIPPDVFNVLTTDLRLEYGTIVYSLFWYRAHVKVEVPHDELHETCDDLLRRTRGSRLTDAQFLEYLNQLVAWRVIDQRINPQRIQSINDWQRKPFHYWIRDEAFRLFQLLQKGLALMDIGPSTGQAKDYARRIQERLADIGRGLETPDPGAGATERLRQAYRDLRHVYGQELHDFRDFLTRLNGSLIEFGRQPIVDFAELQRVVEWLKSYVEETLNYIRNRGTQIVQAADHLLANSTDELNAGYELDRADTNPFDPPTDLSHPKPSPILWGLIHFFEPRGDFDEHADRIRASTNQTLLRLEEHYRRLAESNLVSQYLQLRIQEVLAVDVADERCQRDLQDWTNRLMAPRLVAFAPRIGSNQAQGKPPIPGRFRENRRPPVLDVRAATPTGQPQRQEFELETAQRINEFVETRILRGRDQATLADLDLQTLQDFKDLLDAVKNDPGILGTRIHRRFAFTIHDPRIHPADDLDPVVWLRSAETFTAPNLIVRRKQARQVTPIAEAHT